jgi:hypothetical protein
MLLAIGAPVLVPFLFGPRWAGAVVPFGLAAVAVDAAVVHTLFLIVAYVLMLRGSGERPIHRLWDDIMPAFVSCLGLVVVALPASFALTAAGIPAFLWLAALGLVAVPSYLLTLRVCFPAEWRSQRSILQRIVPGHQRLGGAKRRLAAARVRFSGS